jgi:hypothetical protein
MVVSSGASPQLQQVRRCPFGFCDDVFAKGKDSNALVIMVEVILFAVSPGARSRAREEAGHEEERISVVGASRDMCRRVLE